MGLYKSQLELMGVELKQWWFDGYRRFKAMEVVEAELLAVEAAVELAKRKTYDKVKIEGGRLQTCFGSSSITNPRY
ncbi:hypothetical protein FRX31_018015 [Thalictrum thalictroides]|uniref:Uncharacterized protein n=1 Tax=Thalictrum thalictroides TaxID=46969 RepID=A0A7J6W4U8_THATH|nr:hypothetical protein FRX31_018015 [Thalictrum thalictroides]